MKFLYVAIERQAAELAGFALRSIAPDVAVSWAAGLGQAKRWVDENRNVSALIIEVESDTRSFEALVGHARSVGVKVPVIGIPLIGTSDVMMSVGTVADEVVPRNAAFLDELPKAVGRVLYLTKPQVQQITLPPRAEPLPQQSRDTEAAVAHAEQRAEEALNQLRGREKSLQSAVEQERTARVELERRLSEVEHARQEAEAAHRDADRRRLRDASKFAEDISRRDMQLAEAATLRQALEERCNDAVAALERVRHDRSADAIKVFEDQGRREFELAEKLAHAAGQQQRLEQELAEARRILQLADHLQATTKTDAEARIKSAQQQSEARSAEAAAATSALQRELADAVVALRSLERTSSAQQAQATQAALREKELDTALAHQRAEYQTLGRRLADEEAARRLAEQQAVAERRAAADKVAEQQTAFDSALAQEVNRRQALSAKLADAEVAHQSAVQAFEARLSTTAAALDRFEQQSAAERQAAADSVQRSSRATRENSHASLVVGKRSRRSCDRLTRRSNASKTSTRRP